MKKIEKWLSNQRIAYTINGNGAISITLERDCVWVNGFGEDMIYDKQIKIYKNTYSKYRAVETIGYNRSQTTIVSSRQDDVVEFLEKRLRGR